MEGPRRYYARLIKQALIGALSVSSTWAWLALTALVLAIAAVAFFSGRVASLSNLIAAVVSLAVLLLVLCVRLAIAPFRLYQEDAGKADKAEAVLATAKSYQEKADDLNVFHKSGVLLRNEVPSSHAWKEWNGKVDKWRDDLDAAVTRLFSRSQADAITRLDTFPPIHFPDSIRPEHEHRRSELSARLQRVENLRNDMLKKAIP